MVYIYNIYIYVYHICIHVSIFTYIHIHFVPQKNLGFLKHMKHDQSWNISGFPNAVDAEAGNGALSSRRSASGAGDAAIERNLRFLVQKSVTMFGKKKNTQHLAAQNLWVSVWVHQIRDHIQYSFFLYSQMYGELSSGSKLYMLLSHLWIWVGCLLAIPCTPVVAQEKLGPKAKICS